MAIERRVQSKRDDTATRKRNQPRALHAQNAATTRKQSDAHEFEADERVVAGAQAVAVDLADGGRLADDAAVDHRLVVQLCRVQLRASTLEAD